MGRWRPIEELRRAFRESGIDLGPPTRRRPDTRGCAGKVRHPSRAHAEAVVNEIKRTSFDHPRRNATLGVYPCRHCSFWHGHDRRRLKATRH